MSTQLSFRLGASPRDWMMIRMSTNPFAATGGPIPRITIPLEARLTDPSIELEVLRFMFDLKLGNVLVGQGEIGPLTSLTTHDHYFPAVATCPRDALPLLFNPSPPRGRLTMELVLGGFLRYRHSYPKGDHQAQGLGDPGVWHIESIGEQGIHHLEVQTARSDWYEQDTGIGRWAIRAAASACALAAWAAAVGSAAAFPGTAACRVRARWMIRGWCPSAARDPDRGHRRHPDRPGRGSRRSPSAA